MSVEVLMQPIQVATVFVLCTELKYLCSLSHQDLKYTVLCCRKNFIGLLDSPKFCVKRWGLEGFSSLRFPNISWLMYLPLPVPVASRSKAQVCGRSPAEIVGSNPTGAWKFVCCDCYVLSGRGLCDELITRPEESYGLWCVVVCDLETSRICAPYIYAIRSLRVNGLTLILLTWRKF